MIALLFLLASTACSQDDNVTKTEPDLVARARGIHERVITLDTHNDISTANFTADRNYTMALSTQVNLPNMEAGGLDVSWMVVFVGQGDLTPERYGDAHRQALAKFEAVHRLTEQIAPDRIELALTSDDVRRIIAAGKKVAMIGVENAYPIGTDLSNIELFHEMGARYMSLAHNGHNDISDSANPNPALGDTESEHGGISAFGEEVIAEMNRVGIMVDVSHISKQAMLEAARHSQAPVIASHSSVKALCNVSRNMDDEQLLALRENGGVIQTVALADFVKLDPRRDSAIESLREKFDLPRGPMTPQRLERMSERERADFFQKRTAFDSQMTDIDETFPPANVSDFVDHIDYAVSLIGIDHVGIGTDIDMRGEDYIEIWRYLTQGLLDRGYSREDIEKILGESFLRVFRANSPSE